MAASEREVRAFLRDVINEHHGDHAGRYLTRNMQWHGGTVGTVSGRANVAGLFAGVVASLFSVRISVVSGGVLCVVGCLLCALALPAFRAYDARRYHPAPDPAAGSVKREKQ